MTVFEDRVGPGTLDKLLGVLNNAWAALAVVPEHVRTEVTTAVGEIAANIIEHTSPRHLRMELRRWPERIEIVFRDDGAPVDVDLNAVSMPAPLADRGRGLALAKAFLSELSYERDELFNQWTLVSRSYA